MTDLRLGRRFGFVFAAFRVFMALPDAAAQRSSLETIRRHLRPGGLLVIDLFDPRLGPADSRGPAARTHATSSSTRRPATASR